MQYDFLFGFPIAAGSVQKAWLADSLAADTNPSEIADLEAEQFVAAGFMVRFLEDKMFHLMRRAFGINSTDNSRAGRERSVIRILRQWRQPTMRNLLLATLTKTGYGRYKDPDENPEIWTDELFAYAWADGLNVCLLVQFKRYLAPDVDLPEWMEIFHPDLAKDYRMWLDIGRVALRRLVYPLQAPDQARAESAPALAEAIKPEELRSLRQSVRQLEQDRRDLRERTRRQEQERQQMLSQAQGEVKAARRALSERRQAMEQELSQRARLHAAELQRYQRELENARHEFLRQLGERRRNLLRGQAVRVAGGDGREMRLLVESLGGTFSTETETGTPLAGDRGAVAVELGLHALLLADLTIHCDGLHRRKGARPGISAAAFQAYRDGQPLHEEHRVVCCGPGATSLMAEYAAVLMALRWLVGARPGAGSRAVVRSDNRTLVSCLNGSRPDEMPRGCAQLDRQVRSLLNRLAGAGCRVELQLVRRELVDVEDRLCDLAYREATWYHRPDAEGRRVALQEFLRRS